MRLPAGMRAIELLPQAVERNVAFVPGAAFYADNADPRTLRLSFRDGQQRADQHRHWRWRQPSGPAHPR